MEYERREVRVSHYAPLAACIPGHAYSRPVSHAVDGNPAAFARRLDFEGTSW
ncbi:MAG: hypothetical protein HXM51_03155 [Megasphaera micronuciformis]|nr:hypothetical protein [Megasphaera micronuciformis]